MSPTHSSHTMRSQTSTETKPRESSFVVVLLCTTALTLSMTLICLAATMTLVPRRSENVRQVPDIEWSTYAAIGSLLPILTSLVLLGYIFRTPRGRVTAWIIAGIICFLTHESLTELLRRDFIGKF